MKKILSWLMIVAMVLTPFSLKATSLIAQNTPCFEKVSIGNIKDQAGILQINENKYPLYECLEALYIPLSYLKEGPKVLDLADKTAYINNEPIYLGNLYTYSLRVEEEILIPIEALEILWDIEREGWYYRAHPKKEDLNQYVAMDTTAIRNCSAYTIWLSYKDLYWDGKDVVEIEHTNVLLGPQKEISRMIEKDKGIYLTSFCTELNEWQVDYNEENPYGQKNLPLFKAYTDILTLRELEKVFPPYIVKGKIKYAIGTFKVGEEVEVWRGEKRSYYTVIDQKGKKVNIPWESIDIPTDSWQWLQAVTKEQIEKYAALKKLKSDTGYLVWTDLHRQRTYILKGSFQNWKVEKIMVSSSGKNKYLTPRGSFKLLYRIPYFGLEKGYRCKNAVVIFRDYMYHSILFDKTGQYPKESVYELGQRRSHGCIRLPEEDSAWIYKNVPLESTVWIN